jgi:hypothetical protein
MYLKNEAEKKGKSKEIERFTKHKRADNENNPIFFPKSKGYKA